MAKPLIQMSSEAILNLCESVEIATGGIVSKTLLEGRGVKQIIFSMDTGQEMSAHSSAFPATVQQIEGNLNFTLQKKTFKLKPSDFLMMPAGAEHALVAETPVKFLLTLFKGN